MGQRLNLEIVYGDNVLANSYYHWSGFTRSSLEVARKALEVFDDTRTKGYERYELALDMLEHTGAKFGQQELNAWNSVEFFALFTKIDKKKRNVDNANRNDGFIAITSYGINDTREWEEARITIDIKNKNVLTNIVWKIDSDSIEDYEIDTENVREVYFNFEKFRFDEIDNIINQFKEIAKNDDYIFKKDNEFYEMIE